MDLNYNKMAKYHNRMIVDIVCQLLSMNKAENHELVRNEEFDVWSLNSSNITDHPLSRGERLLPGVFRNWHLLVATRLNVWAASILVRTAVHVASDAASPVPRLVVRWRKSETNCGELKNVRIWAARDRLSSVARSRGQLLPADAWTEQDTNEPVHDGLQRLDDRNTPGFGFSWTEKPWKRNREKKKPLYYTTRGEFEVTPRNVANNCEWQAFQVVYFMGKLLIFFKCFWNIYVIQHRVLEKTKKEKEKPKSERNQGTEYRERKAFLNRERL